MHLGPPAGKQGSVKIVGIIPARYTSTRCPGKPLARIAGRTLIQHVIERCQQAKSLAEVVVDRPFGVPSPSEGGPG